MTNFRLSDLVENCGQDWHSMSPCETGSRHCGECNTVVVNVRNFVEMVSAWNKGLCVAVDEVLHIDEGVVPEEWKVGHVGVIYAKDSTNPISRRGVAYKNPEEGLL